MARAFGKIFASQWDDEDFLTLGADAKYIYDFLVAQSDLGHSGIITLRIAPWARRLSKTIGEVETALRELHQRRYIVADDDEMLLLVRSLIRRDDVYKQPNVFKAAASQVYACPSKPIRAVLLSELERLDETAMRGDTVQVCADLVAWLRKTTGNPSPNPPGEGSGNPQSGESPDIAEFGHATDITAGEEGSANPSGKPLPRAPARAGVPLPLPLPLAPSGNPNQVLAASGTGQAQLSLVPDLAADEPPTRKPETEGQRVYRLAHTYTDRVKLCNYNAVAGVVKKAVQAGRDDGTPLYTDRQIADALSALIETGWGVSADTLRIAIEGLPRQRTNGHTGFRDDPDRDYSLAGYLAERNGA